MRYHYEPKNSIRIFGERFEHPKAIFRSATLYKIRGKGLLVVTENFDERTKSFYYEELPSYLANDIYIAGGFADYFRKTAKYPDENGLYPVVNIRKIMWALRMKPIKKAWWEEMR